MIIRTQANQGRERSGDSTIPTRKITRKSVLEDAERTVNGSRPQDYGSPEDNFKRISKLWSAYTGTFISEIDVAMMMSLLKIARIRAGGTEDSFIDLAGYAACGGELFGNNGGNLCSVTSISGSQEDTK